MWCGIGLGISAIGLYMMALPHFITGYNDIATESVKASGIWFHCYRYIWLVKVANINEFSFLFLIHHNKKCLLFPAIANSLQLLRVDQSWSRRRFDMKVLYATCLFFNFKVANPNLAWYNYSTKILLENYMRVKDLKI